MPSLASFWCYCPRSWSLDCLRSSGGRNPVATSSQFPSCVSECRPWTHFSTSSDVKCSKKRQWFLAEKAAFGRRPTPNLPCSFYPQSFCPQQGSMAQNLRCLRKKKSADKELWGKQQTEERFGTTFYYIAFSIQKSSTFTLGFRVFPPSALEMSEVIGVHL